MSDRELNEGDARVKEPRGEGGFLGMANEQVAKARAEAEENLRERTGSMTTELERSRERLADAVLRIVSSSNETDITLPTRVASEALEDIFGYPGAFKPVDQQIDFTVSFKQPTPNSVTAVVSYQGIEIDREPVYRPSEGPGVLGAARFHANGARYHRWDADCMRAAGKSESLIREALQKAEEEESALRDLVSGNPGEFNRHALAAQPIRAWLKGPKDDAKDLIEALATESLPYSPADVSRARRAMRGEHSPD